MQEPLRLSGSCLFFLQEQVGLVERFVGVGEICQTFCRMEQDSSNLLWEWLGLVKRSP